MAALRIRPEGGQFGSGWAWPGRDWTPVRPLGRIPRNPKQGNGYRPTQSDSAPIGLNAMDCRTFVRNHAAYIDDTLPGVEMTAMSAHIVACAACARRDSDIRRALLLLRNMPPLRTSEGFEDRLRQRLAAEVGGSARANRERRWPTFGAMAGAAAAAAAVIAMAMAFWPDAAGGRPLPRLAAVTASSPPPAAFPGDDVATPAFVSSMSTGLPMWPALMLAEEGPLRFATTDVRTVGWESAKPRD